MSAERTPWARDPSAPLRTFLHTETGGAVVLLAATLAALAWANSPWPASYEAAWTTELAFRVGDWSLSQDLRHWVNDGLMTLFFLVVGLEAERELDFGHGRERRRVTLSLVEALGGMALPVAIFLAVNAGGPGAPGWGAVMSTDTALTLGLLALAAAGGARLRARLLTRAVFDNLVALLVIATVSTRHLHVLPLAVSIALLGVLVTVRPLRHAWGWRATTVIGVAIWVALSESGVDPVIGGLAIGLVSGASPPPRARLHRMVELTRRFREQPTPQLARSAGRGVASAVSPSERLQHRLHPWISFVVVPLFALANAGLPLDGDVLGRALTSPITLGIVAAYALGKPLGIIGASALAVRLGLGPSRLSRQMLADGGVVVGVGFTVSLLAAAVAFQGRALEEAKLGVLFSAVVASAGGWAALRLLARLPEPIGARVVPRVAEDDVDLSDDVDVVRDHVRGRDAAPVTLVEYGDYECPFCGRGEVAVRELLRSFGDELRYVWRHLPLSDVHPHAQLAAEAAEAAAAQGAFWEMHDRLLGHQDVLEEADLARHAEALGLDRDRFADDLRSHRHAERVAGDVASADASGVPGTPTFFINGLRHHGAYDAATLGAAVRLLSGSRSPLRGRAPGRRPRARRSRRPRRPGSRSGRGKR